MNLNEIKNQIFNCTKCELHKTRTNTVPGKGNYNAKVIVIGEAPGRFEDLQGEPFVGRGGNLLTKCLSEVGINREDVFITNIVKCRPPENRRPTKIESKACTPFLDMQIEAINPKVIVTLGAVSGEYISKKFNCTWTAMLKENGKPKKVNTLTNQLILLPILHPAAVLRDPNKKGIFISALKTLLTLIQSENIN